MDKKLKVFLNNNKDIRILYEAILGASICIYKKIKNPEFRDVGDTHVYKAEELVLAPLIAELEEGLFKPVNYYIKNRDLTLKQIDKYSNAYVITPEEAVLVHIIFHKSDFSEENIHFLEELMNDSRSFYIANQFFIKNINPEAFKALSVYTIISELTSLCCLCFSQIKKAFLSESNIVPEELIKMETRLQIFFDITTSMHPHSEFSFFNENSKSLEKIFSLLD